MKVLHLSTSDSAGGAARSAHRIHAAFAGSGVDSRMQVLYRGTDDPTVQAVPPRGLAARIGLRLRDRWLARGRRGWHSDNTTLHSFGEAGAGIAGRLDAAAADVLNLHWVPGLLSIADIGRLAKPLVWTLHDMWAFCGGEHYAPDDASARFRHGYRTDNRPAGERGPDLDRRAWEAKRRAWMHQRFTVVAPSQWLARCARESVLFAESPVHVVPYAIDAERTWRPVPRAAARAALGLPPAARLVLMGADGGVADPRKGGDLLREAIARVVQAGDDGVELVVYGQARPAGDTAWPCPVHWLGPVRDDRVLVLAYSAADAMVVPSRQDNLPNTALEAQACGTPVVAFDVGGLPDIVVHGETGWLAPAFDTAALAEGVRWAIGDAERARRLSEAARRRALERYAPAMSAERYRAIYEEAAARCRG
jgi:glycosyltransferase involved in cell wall biosynthesis